MYKKTKKITMTMLALPLLLMVGIHATSSYAACAGTDFISQANKDNTLRNILSGTSSGKPCPVATPNQIVAIVGSCPDDVMASCSALSGPQQTLCQQFAMGAYYGKVQAACNYLANVQAADNSYKAPPPQPRTPPTGP